MLIVLKISYFVSKFLACVWGVHAYWHVHVNTCVCVFLHCSPLYCWDRISYWHWNSLSPPSLASLTDSGILAVSPGQGWQVTATPAWLVFGCWGSRLEFSHLPGELFTWWVVFPVPWKTIFIWYIKNLVAFTHCCWVTLRQFSGGQNCKSYHVMKLLPR